MAQISNMFLNYDYMTLNMPGLTNYIDETEIKINLH